MSTTPYRGYFSSLVEAYDSKKSLLQNVEALSGEKLKPGRNVIKGYPADIEGSEGEIIVTGVDKDATTSLLKLFRGARFKAKRNGDTEFTLSEGFLSEGFMGYSVVDSDTAADLWHDCKKTDGSGEAVAACLTKGANYKNNEYNTPGWINAAMVMTEKYMKLAQSSPKMGALAKKLAEHIEDVAIPAMKGKDTEEARELLDACVGLLKKLKKINDSHVRSKRKFKDQDEWELHAKKMRYTIDKKGKGFIAHRSNDTRGEWEDGKGWFFEAASPISRYYKLAAAEALSEAKLHFVITLREGAKLKGYFTPSEADSTVDGLAKGQNDAKKFKSYSDAMKKVHELNGLDLPKDSYFYVEPI